MKYRMAAAVLALAGVILAAYLYLFKLGLIGTLACGRLIAYYYGA